MLGRSPSWRSIGGLAAATAVPLQRWPVSGSGLVELRFRATGLRVLSRSGVHAWSGSRSVGGNGQTRTSARFRQPRRRPGGHERYCLGRVRIIAELQGSSRASRCKRLGPKTRYAGAKNEPGKECRGTGDGTQPLRGCETTSGLLFCRCSNSQELPEVIQAVSAVCQSAATAWESS
jgi:hypothetical protein